MIQTSIRDAYSFLKRVSRSGVVLALTLPGAAQTLPALEPARSAEEAPDGRATRLADFFRARRSPLGEHAAAFIEAADKYELDWRLLPALAMLESGGGRVYKWNNIFGWASGRAKFDSVRDGIFAVAGALARNAPYRGKALRDKLRAYNPRNRWYPDHVFRVFRQISPEAPGVAAGAGR